MIDTVVLEPYYMCHVASLQLAGSQVVTCAFDKATYKPDWSKLEELISTRNPKLVVVTSPSNPSGAVWTWAEYQRIVELCRHTGTWIVFDQTYDEFLFDGAQHIYPCGSKLGYKNIVHLFSFSKAYGMPGWRVGFTIAPTSLTDSFRKLQDTIPTCAAIISQKLAERCLHLEERLCAESLSQSSSSLGNNDKLPLLVSSSPWVQSKIQSLSQIREAVWEAVAPMGTIRTNGAFYFLVPVPAFISEDEAVDILAIQFKVLLMPGRAFGADNYMRLSYGSLDPAVSMAAVERLRLGFQHLLQLSEARKSAKRL